MDLYTSCLKFLPSRGLLSKSIVIPLQFYLDLFVHKFKHRDVYAAPRGEIWPLILLAQNHRSLSHGPSIHYRNLHSGWMETCQRQPKHNYRGPVVCWEVWVTSPGKHGHVHRRGILTLRASLSGTCRKPMLGVWGILNLWRQWGTHV